MVQKLESVRKLKLNLKLIKGTKYVVAVAIAGILHFVPGS
jgi:hypothetical protein